MNNRPPIVMMRWAVMSLVLTACVQGRAVLPRPVPAAAAPPPAPAATPRFRLRLCTESPVHLHGLPDAQQSRGCVVTFRQRLSDPLIVQTLGATEVERRYLVYAPANLPSHPVPVVLVFPGYSSSAEAIAFHTTHTRFETLADRDGFVVVYGNGLPNPPTEREHPSVPKGGFLSGCLAAHTGEGVDVTYVRQLLDQLGAEIPLDRTRIYATGMSAGGGMAFQLAIEAPDLVAAIAPVVPLPFQPTSGWLLHCHPKAGYDRISVAMVAATNDPFISYTPGSSREYPEARYPGMEQARDNWVAALGLSGPPEIDRLPDSIQGDSYQPDSGLTTSTVERQRYLAASDGRELWYYKATGMGHAWPNPTQTWPGMWSRFGKTNQDVDFSDEAWRFFRRHAKRDSRQSNGGPAAPR